MALLTVSAISKHYGETLVLHNCSLIVNQRDRIGLVGANGVGKSTLLRIILGEIEADGGSVRLEPGCEVGYLAQAMENAAGQSVAHLLAEARGKLDLLEERLRTLEQQMAHPGAGGDSATTLAEYAALAEEFERRGGYERHETDEVLAGLGLAEVDRERPVATLSGGEKARLGLAALLLRAPDLLILDEPTNHLDFAALAWLETYLAESGRALLIVSHDRQFLDNTVTSIAEIDEHSRELTLYTGAYGAFAEVKANARLHWLADYEAQQQEIRALRKQIKTSGRQVAHNRPPKDNDGFIYSFKGARVDATVARNVRSAEEKLRRIEEDPIPKPPRPLAVNPEFDPALFGSKTPIVLSQAHKAYGERVILEDLSCVVASRARIVIVGPNGAGKSTLVKALAGVLPLDRGSLTRAPGVQIGYLDQEQETLATTGTVYEAYAAGQSGDYETLKAELLATGLFTWPELGRTVGVLSVGQKRKLQIARLLAVHANVLLLDEPTNHISLDVLEEFENALARFEGPIVAISHDRRFIERFGSELWEVEDGRLRRYAGGWDEYIARAQSAPRAV